MASEHTGPWKMVSRMTIGYKGEPVMTLIMQQKNGHSDPIKTAAYADWILACLNEPAKARGEED